MNYEKEIEKAKKELINLFFKLNATNKQEVNKLLLIYYIIKYYQIEQLKQDNIIQKNLKLNEKTILDLINLIRDTIDMVIYLKADKAAEKMIKNDIKNSGEYEKLLRQLESELRRNIAIQNQLKVQIERMQFDIINHESVIIYLSNIFYLINRKKIMTMIKFYF